MGFRPDDVIAGQHRFQKAALTRPRVPLPVGIGHAVQQDRGRAQSVRPDDVNAKTVDRAGAGKSNEMVARTRPRIKHLAELPSIAPRHHKETACTDEH